MSICIFRQGTHTISVYDVAGVNGRKKYVYKKHETRYRPGLYVGVPEPNCITKCLAVSQVQVGLVPSFATEGAVNC